jgi:choline-sulfatase
MTRVDQQRSFAQMKGSGMPRPNVLLIMADQVVPFLTSAYGDPVAKTPNMARLVEEGVRFDAAYTPFPLCAPARASLMTGKYASDTGCFDNASILPSDEPTIGHYLSNAGYDTCLSGKMHFIGPDQLHGFARRLTTDVFPAGVDWVPVVDENGKFPAGGHAREYTAPEPGVRSWTKFMAYDEETQFRALEYLRERGRLGTADPFCAVVSYHHPHDPFHVGQELWDLYEGADIPIPTYPEDLECTYSAMDRWANEAHETAEYQLDDPESLTRLRRAYYASLTYVDRKIGELVEALRASGELDRTVIIFTSDHGDMLAERRMVQKRCFYEWSARIPLVIRFPDGSHAGRKIVEPVTLLDILPTLANLAGVQADQLPSGDGKSLLDILSNGEMEDRAVFSEYHLEKVWAPCFMVRRGRYKFIYIHGHGEQLFDLESDPDEWDNLARSSGHSGVQAELKELIFERFDPDRLAAEGAASIRRREIVKEAMRRNDTHWDYAPFFDATRQYVR